MLTKKEMEQLRNKIVLNSMFYSDYGNSFGIDEKRVFAFFDGFTEYITHDESGDYIGDDKYLDALEKYDNIDAIYNYYLDYDYGF